MMSRATAAPPTTPTIAQTYSSGKELWPRPVVSGLMSVDRCEKNAGSKELFTAVRPESTEIQHIQRASKCNTLQDMIFLMLSNIIYTICMY